MVLTESFVAGLATWVEQMEIHVGVKNGAMAQ
jgi:hypothetical protein